MIAFQHGYAFQHGCPFQHGCLNAACLNSGAMMLSTLVGSGRRREKENRLRKGKHTVFNKTVELKALLLEHGPDVVCITET